MEYVFVRKANGKESHHSNLAPVRRMATGAGVATVNITDSDNGGGFLYVGYGDGSRAMARFASRKVLGQWVARWRNAEGADLFVEFRPVGRVFAGHPALK